MNEILNKNNKYSRTQYFFWLLSGAEISILKDCPTDYNRQAGIGFTIFMTTLLAFCSGTYAGYYFGESYLTAVIFGAIWASLIFSIDRSMVVTLKKDPTKNKQSFIVAFLSRALLAVLIAFIISIPLELLIFKENIELHMDKYKLDQIYSVQQAAIRNEAIGDKQNRLNNDNLIYKQVSDQLTNGEPQGDPEFDILKAEVGAMQITYNQLLSALKSARTKAEIAYRNVPYLNNSDVKNQYSEEWKIYKKNEAKIKQAEFNFNQFDLKRFNQLKLEKKNYIDNWIVDLKNKQRKLNENISTTSESISKGFATADSAKNLFQEKIVEKKGFVLRFMILEDLAKRERIVRKAIRMNNYNDSEVTSDSVQSANISSNNSKFVEEIEYNPEGASIFLLLWLIRFLFFTIEILPTIAKIATPIGAYDRAIFRKEMDLAEDLELRTSEYLMQQSKIREIEYQAEILLTKERTELENKLYTELIKEISLVQNKIARDKIDEFKKQNSSNK